MAAGGFEESVTCSVCLDVFKTPKVLSCGHSFCLEPCLRDLTANQRQNHRHKHKSINCPLCRAKVTLPKSGQPRDFPTNFSLQNILETKVRESAKDNCYSDLSGLMGECRPAPPTPCVHLTLAEFYCEECEQFLCPECACRFHGGDGHNIIAKDTAMERARIDSEKMVSERMAELERKIKRCNELLGEARVSSLSYEAQVSHLKTDVQRVMGSLRKDIDERERRYLGELCAQSESTKLLYMQFEQKWEMSKAEDLLTLKPFSEILLQVQAGDLSSMNQVMGVGPVDVMCTAMAEEKRLALPVAPPFVWVKDLHNSIPELRQKNVRL